MNEAWDESMAVGIANLGVAVETFDFVGARCIEA